MDLLNDAEEAMLRCLDELYVKAQGIVERHWQMVLAEEKKISGWEQKSSLQLRCNRKGNAIKLEWVKIRWAGSKAKGTRKAIREYIRKGKGDGYNLNTLIGLAKDWERPLVEHSEKSLREIKREWRYITKALQLIRFAKDARKAAMAADKNGGSDA